MGGTAQEEEKEVVAAAAALRYSNGPRHYVGVLMFREHRQDAAENKRSAVAALTKIRPHANTQGTRVPWMNALDCL